MANTEARFTETLGVSRNNGKTSEVKQWRDKQTETEVLPGFYLQAGLGYRFHPGWSLNAYGRYDWSDSISGTVGPSSYKVDLNGWTVGASLDWHF